MGAGASVIVTLLPRLGRFRVMANPVKPVAGWILQSFNNLETNAGLVVGIRCPSQDRESVPVQTQRVGVWAFEGTKPE